MKLEPNKMYEVEVKQSKSNTRHRTLLITAHNVGVGYWVEFPLYGEDRHIVLGDIYAIRIVREMKKIKAFNTTKGKLLKPEELI